MRFEHFALRTELLIRLREELLGAPLTSEPGLCFLGPSCRLEVRHVDRGGKLLGPTHGELWFHPIRRSGEGAPRIRLWTGLGPSGDPRIVAIHPRSTSVRSFHDAVNWLNDPDTTVPGDIASLATVVRFLWLPRYFLYLLGFVRVVGAAEELIKVTPLTGPKRLFPPLESRSFLSVRRLEEHLRSTSDSWGISWPIDQN